VARHDGLVVSLCLALAVGACATAANTPQQDLAYERWAKCRVAYVQLQDVSVDGRIGFLFTGAADRETVLRCLADAGRTGTPLPEPWTTRPPGGP
jgi:hypothetical protein